MQEMQVQSLSWEDHLEKEIATNSSILAWEIPWTEESGWLQSMGHEESDTTQRLSNSNNGLFASCSLIAVYGRQIPVIYTTCTESALASWCIYVHVCVIFICCCSVAKLCLTLCDPMNYSAPGFPVLHHLLELG